jgi:glycosyltransferase involved in cell wall biosynthesis
MRISVLIPTWRRPGALSQCLDALEDQDRTADEVVVVVRLDDDETKRSLGTRQPGDHVRIVTVAAPGVVAALNHGLAFIRNRQNLASIDDHVVVMTDDDTVPRPDWLRQIESHFSSDPHLGGLGGRDWLHPPSTEGDESTVGVLRWYGRLVGNHHLGAGGPRRADVLKGANMSLRLGALGESQADERLRGSGPQAHWEIDLCWAVARRGWKLVYDSAVSVDHYPSERFEDDSRSGPVTGKTLEDVVHNETYLLLKWLPWWRRFAATVYWLLVGTRVAPGLLLLAERLLRQRDRRSVFHRYRAALRGRFAGARTFISAR